MGCLRPANCLFSKRDFSSLSGASFQTCQPHNPDDHIDSTVSDEAMKNLNKGKSESEFFCDLDAEVGEDCEVVDLAINPER